MKIIIVGAGQLGYHLAKNCASWGCEVAVVEQDPSRCERIKTELGLKAIAGDGTSPHFLRKAGAQDADLVLAVTGDDQDNLVVCQLAERQFNVRRTVAVVNTPGNEKLFRWLGVNQVVSPTSLILGLVRNEEQAGTFFMQDVKDLKMIQLRLDQYSPVLGQKIKDIILPNESILVTIVRGEEAIVPRGNTELEEGDLVFALANPDVQQQLESLLKGNGSHRELGKL